MVNRLWQHHFGRGIVATPSDFGTQGRPTHPELLDWLATELVGRGWSLKALHRLMVTSATYRQSSTFRARRAAEADPDNTPVQPDVTAGGSRAKRCATPCWPSRASSTDAWAVRASSQPAPGWRRGRLDPVDVGRRPEPPERLRLRAPNLKYPLFDAFDFPDSNTTCPSVT